MCVDPYVLPVKWLGNVENPHLIILLCNPGGDPKWPKRMPEGYMELDGVYKDSGMSLTECRKYNGWWDDFFGVFETHNINPSDVLLLEFYPYHSVSSGAFSHNPDKWNEYARAALNENIAILRRHMARGVLVFGYYWGDWLRVVPELNSYANFSQGAWKKQKIKELSNFISKGV